MAFNQGNTKAAKLTPVEVNEIREKYATGLYTYERLCLEYGVSVNTVRSIVKGTSWQSLPMITPTSVVDDAALRSQRKLDEMLSQAAALGGDVLPTNDLPSDTLAAMQHAVDLAAKPDRLMPSADQSERMAAYGVRPPVPQELANQLAAPERGRHSAVTISSKPALQAQTMQDASQGHTDVPAPISIDDAEFGMKEHRVDPLDETTEESAK